MENIVKRTREIFMYSLGAVICIGFFAVMIVALRSAADVDNMLTGALVASFTAVVQYFYGSSKGSSDKTDLITKNGA